MTWTAAVVLLVWAGASAAHAAVLVAYESGVEAYAEALEGLKEVLGPGGVQVLDLRTAGNEPELPRLLAARNVRIVVAMGSQALAAVRSHNAAVAVIATMVFRSNDLAGIIGHVDVEVPLSSLLAEIRALLPQHRRVGIIRSRGPRGQTLEAIEGAARREGFIAVVVDCDGPANLLRLVGELKGTVDFLLCFPDADLYNSVTIKPLILATLQQRLPVVGFSPAFVRAGAVVGIYADYRDVGRQTAEMVLRAARGEEQGGEEAPRKLHAAVNQRVARLLGIEIRTDSLPVEVFR